MNVFLRCNACVNEIQYDTYLDHICWLINFWQRPRAWFVLDVASTARAWDQAFQASSFHHGQGQGLPTEPVWKGQVFIDICESPKIATFSAHFQKLFHNHNNPGVTFYQAAPSEHAAVKEAQVTTLGWSSKNLISCWRMATCSAHLRGAQSYPKEKVEGVSTTTQFDSHKNVQEAFLATELSEPWFQQQTLSQHRQVQRRSCIRLKPICHCCPRPHASIPG